ncbi:11012_t:CDS:2, partial [Racocetra fulgida]
YDDIPSVSTPIIDESRQSDYMIENHRKLLESSSKYPPLTVEQQIQRAQKNPEIYPPVHVVNTFFYTKLMQNGFGVVAGWFTPRPNKKKKELRDFFIYLAKQTNNQHFKFAEWEISTGSIMNENENVEVEDEDSFEEHLENMGQVTEILCDFVVEHIQVQAAFVRQSERKLAKGKKKKKCILITAAIQTCGFSL